MAQYFAQLESKQSDYTIVIKKKTKVYFIYYLLHICVLPNTAIRAFFMCRIYVR